MPYKADRQNACGHYGRPATKTLCYPCYHKVWRKNNRAKTRQYVLNWRKKYPERAKIVDQKSHARSRQLYKTSKEHRKRCAFNAIRLRYGLSRTQYEELLQKQDGKCAICETEEPGMKRGFFAVDHDHNSGVVRGLLCLSCNIGLGAFKDAPKTLQKAAQYLEKYKCVVL